MRTLLINHTPVKEVIVEPYQRNQAVNLACVDELYPMPGCGGVPVSRASERVGI